MAVARLQSTGRMPARSAAPVAVIEPIQAVAPKPLPAPVPTPSALAGPASLSPQQYREYWSYELPAEPMTPPLGVMLQRPRSDLATLAPQWATTVVSFWPVPFQSERSSEPLVSSSLQRPTLPTSTLQTLAWKLLQETEPEGPATQLILLSILPSWSLPHPCDSEAAAPASATSLAPLRPSRPAADSPMLVSAASVSLALLQPRRPLSFGLGVAISADSVGFATQCLWSMARSVGDVRRLVIAEQARHSARLDRLLELNAETLGLGERLAIRDASALPWPPRIAISPNSFAFRQSLVRPCTDFRPPLLQSSLGMQAVTLPPIQQRPFLAPSATETAPTNGETHFPAPPSIRLAWSFAKSLLPAKPLLAAQSPAKLVPVIVAPVAPTILERPATRFLPARVAAAVDLVPVAAPAPRNPALGSVDPLPEKPTITINLLDRHLDLIAPGASPPALFPLHSPPALASFRILASAVIPLPGTPIVIVPHSVTRNQHQSTALRLHLFSLAHLVPGPRKQLAVAPAIDPSAWRARPIWPTTALPRISLKEKNSTRTIALTDVRNVLQKQTFDRAKRFWKLAPADLKWLAFGLPLILGFWLWPTHPVAISVPSPISAVSALPKPDAATSFLEKAAQINLSPNFDALQERIASRASIHIEEDFSAGLGLWEGEGNWARSWTYDKGGVVRPGRMAIYQPSIPMVDYTFDLSAAVERRSISWMVRATNLRNYVAARLNVSGSGPSQQLSFERWTVKDGRVTRRQTMPIQSRLGNATTVKIRMEVSGNTFATSLQDQTIDVFTDGTHPSGGIGLFSGDGDQPRIYRMELTHQHDFFGKLCSFLAPHPITKAGTIRP